MKILITTDLYTTATNGVVTSVRNLTDQLRSHGHDVRILTLSDTSRSYKNNHIYYIRSVSLPVYPDVRMPLAYRHRLLRELVDWKPDVIHSQCEFFTFQFALYIAKRTSAPLVHTYHTLYEQYTRYVVPGKRLGKFIAKTFSKYRLEQADKVIAPTSKIEDTLLHYGIETEISVIPSGISLEQHSVRISPEERTQLRKKLGLDDHQTVMVNLGRLGGEKNLQELVTLYAQAAEHNPDLRFLLVGDGPAKESLQSLAQSLGVADRVIFAGMVPPDQVQAYYQLGDIFVSASTSETQGLTYDEAAANGLPLLCREDLCLKDIIRQGENGFSYTNEAEFWEMIGKMAKDPVWREAAGKYSEEAASKFDKKFFGETVEKTYQQIIGK